MALSIDCSSVGREFDHTVFEPVTKAEILEYAAAYGETDPLCTDEAAAKRGPYGTLIAPLTFPLCLRRRQFVPTGLLTDAARGGFDAGKDIEFGVRVRVGDVLTSSSTVHDVYEKTGRSGRMTFVVIRTSVTNQGAQIVAVIDQRMMVRLGNG